MLRHTRATTDMHAHIHPRARTDNTRTPTGTRITSCTHARPLRNADIHGEEKISVDDLSGSDRHHVRSLATNFILENLAQLGLRFKERR